MKISKLITELTAVLENVGDEEVSIYNGCIVDGVIWNGEERKVILDTNDLSPEIEWNDI